ncbi:MAG TPA: hypothetical protein VII92_08040 [Anaerolineae bacterium]
MLPSGETNVKDAPDCTAVGNQRSQNLFLEVYSDEHVAVSASIVEIVVTLIYFGARIHLVFSPVISITEAAENQQ